MWGAGFCFFFVLACMLAINLYLLHEENKDDKK